MKSKEQKDKEIKEWLDKCMSECEFDVPPLPDNRTQEEKDADYERLVSMPLFPNYSRENFKRVFDFVTKDR